MEAGFISWIAQALGINVLRLAIYGVVAASVAGGAVALKYHYIDVGHQQALDEIAAGNRETLNHVNDAVAKVDACRIIGRQWNTVVGVCD